MGNNKSKINFEVFNTISVALLIIGILLIVIGCIAAEPIKSICMSIGSSLAASAVATIIYRVTDKMREKEMDEKLESIMDLLTENSPDGRACFGRHLTNAFPSMLEKYSEKDVIKVDIIGLELYRFYEDQFENLKKYPNLQMRMIIQDPCSKNFNSIIYHEGRNAYTVFKNIVKLTEAIKTYNETVEEERQIKLYWMGYPSSVTITRVGNEMYVRPRFLKEGEGGDNMFFEKYFSKYGKTFSVYTDFFEKAISFSKEPLKDDELLEKAKEKLKELKKENDD